MQTLLCPFSSSEVLQALKSLGSEVCPGEDGLTRDVFLQYWDIIADDLTSAFQIIFYSGAMPEEWKEGLICLIPKGDEALEDIRAWQPITLLNTLYKFMLRYWHCILQPLLLDIIHTSQAGFMQYRSIFDNIFLFWELSASAMAKKEHLIILLLDFEKAYDRVNWDFLEEAMRRLGFPEAWIIVVATLYRLAYSSILVAGGRGRRFQMSRSVRQGCLLAPFLFLIVTEVFSAYLNSTSFGIQGLIASISNKIILDVEFAYDTALYMHVEEGN